MLLLLLLMMMMMMMMVVVVVVVVCLCVVYTVERWCFVTQSVVTLANNCSTQYTRQLLGVNSTHNSQPHQTICRSFQFQFQF